MIVLLTDFGTSDPYVGQMKGALISKVPDCRIVDLTHEIPPYGLTQAAFFLESSQRYFPEGTLFLTVVDPGVGGPRRIVCLETNSKLFLAPDNGVLGLVVENSDDCLAFDLSHPLLPCASSTFHGRDVFAPLAAELTVGDSPETLGRAVELTSLVRLEWCAPSDQERVTVCHALHVDHFGNVITNLGVERYNAKLNGDIEVRTSVTKLPVRRVRSYCDIERGTLGLLAGSQGYFELAMNMGSAADLLSLTPGEQMSLRFSSGV